MAATGSSDARNRKRRERRTCAAAYPRRKTTAAAGIQGRTDRRLAMVAGSEFQELRGSGEPPATRMAGRRAAHRGRPPSGLGWLRLDLTAANRVAASSGRTQAAAQASRTRQSSEAAGRGTRARARALAFIGVGRPRLAHTARLPKGGAAVARLTRPCGIAGPRWAWRAGRPGRSGLGRATGSPQSNRIGFFLFFRIYF
jgi:hypothetical protein